MDIEVVYGGDCKYQSNIVQLSNLNIYSLVVNLFD